MNKRKNKYILVEILTNNVRYNEACSDSKQKLESHLKSKGYYWSNKYDLYIDDKNKDSSIDYTIEEVKEIS